MESLGMLDAIIATLMESPKYMMSKKRVVVNLPEMLDLLEKLRMVLQRGGDLVKKSVTVDPERGQMVQKKSLAETNPEIFGLEGEALLRQAKDQAEKIKGNADKYAENVLTNLQVIVTKMMRNIETGKDRLKKYQDVAQ